MIYRSGKKSKRIVEFASQLGLAKNKQGLAIDGSPGQMLEEFLNDASILREKNVDGTPTARATAFALGFCQWINLQFTQTWGEYYSQDGSMSKIAYIRLIQEIILLDYIQTHFTLNAYYTTQLDSIYTQYSTALENYELDSSIINSIAEYQVLLSNYFVTGQTLSDFLYQPDQNNFNMIEGIFGNFELLPPHINL